MTVLINKSRLDIFLCKKPQLVSAVFLDSGLYKVLVWGWVFLFKSMQCNQTGDSTVGVLRVQGQTCKWVRATARKTEQHVKWASNYNISNSPKGPRERMAAQYTWSLSAFQNYKRIVLKEGTVWDFSLPIFCSHFLPHLFVYSVLTAVRNIRI